MHSTRPVLETAVMLLSLPILMTLFWPEPQLERQPTVYGLVEQRLFQIAVRVGLVIERRIYQVQDLPFYVLFLNLALIVDKLNSIRKILENVVVPVRAKTLAQINVTLP